MVKEFRNRLLWYACAFGSVLLFRECYSLFGTVVVCEGISMEPTVQNGDYLLAERISVTLKRLKIGDVVVAAQPRRPEDCSPVLKRIKGLGHDQITYWDNAHWNMITTEVPADHVWLEGDNSRHSLDSRKYGPVPMSRLEYKILIRLWPLDHFGRLDPLQSADSTMDTSSPLLGIASKGASATPCASSSQNK
ncbi:unnamed protein product [Calicophoron daubneyi]|uniref:Peptidase S26 domain-containing protein n=1 Tax=Calicophoron daubneyi TaxID=300641 RepID=A0AAV2T1X9_CALDB